MSILKERLRQKIYEWRPRISKLMEEYGDVEVDKVTIGQILGGMRGINSIQS
ncbi:MAG: hypothetical protein NT175_11260 [Bacteroidetes bacterium]|nr:hypothetical protein [Bacteroidota bacterium]